MSEPTSKEEYETRSFVNTYVSGFGLDVKQHLACPFCGAKDWAAVRVMDFAKEIGKRPLETPTKCTACDRAAVLVFDPRGEPEVTRFMFYQTEGKDPAPWVPITRKPEL